VTSETDAITEHYRGAGRAELERQRGFRQCPACFAWHGSAHCPNCADVRALRLRITWHDHLNDRRDAHARLAACYVQAYGDGGGEWCLRAAAQAAAMSDLYANWAAIVLAPGTEEIVNANAV
jgi:hypothetical protein